MSFLKIHFPGIVLFLVALAIGVSCYKDYGISFDEPTQRAVGLVTYNYVTKGDQQIKSYCDRDLGTGFELPLIFLEKALHITDSMDICHVRHLATHIYFLLGAFCAWLLAYSLFGNRFVAALGFLLIAANPRLYAHSFFNTKDIPFLTAFLMALTVCRFAFLKNKGIWFVLLGVACGYAASIRIMGVLLIPCVCTLLIMDAVAARKKGEQTGSVIFKCALFVVCFFAMLYLSWPLLWSDPFHYIREELINHAHIFWDGNVLFNGKIISANNLPWTYVPAWIAITTPELWLISGAFGIASVSVAFFRNPGLFTSNTTNRNFLLYLVCFGGPIVTIVLLKSINYDDWRHLYFVYPPLVMLTLFPVAELLKSKLKTITVTLSIVQIGITTWFTIKNHPFQQVYFNNFVPHHKEYLRNHYDLDYWGCAFKQGVEYILEHDTAATIRLSDWTFPVHNAVNSLPESKRKRILLVADTDHPDYFITHFRLHPADYNYPMDLYDIRVLNSTIMRVYKLK